MLRKGSSGWHGDKHDYTSSIKQLLGIILNCYRDLTERLGPVDRKRTPYEIVRKAVANTLRVFTKARILQRSPDIGSSSVEAPQGRRVHPQAGQWLKHRIPVELDHK